MKPRGSCATDQTVGDGRPSSGPKCVKAVAGSAALPSALTASRIDAATTRRKATVALEALVLLFTAHSICNVRSSLMHDHSVRTASLLSYYFAIRVLSNFRRFLSLPRQKQHQQSILHPAGIRKPAGRLVSNRNRSSKVALSSVSPPVVAPVTKAGGNVIPPEAAQSLPFFMQVPVGCTHASCEFLTCTMTEIFFSVSKTPSRSSLPIGV